MNTFEDYITNLIPTSQAFLREASFNTEEIISMFCKMLMDAKQDPLLKAFIAKLYDHYNSTTHSDRIALFDYLKIIENTLPMKLVRSEVNG